MNHSQATTIAAVVILLMSVVAPVGMVSADAQPDTYLGDEADDAPRTPDQTLNTSVEYDLIYDAPTSDGTDPSIDTIAAQSDDEYVYFEITYAGTLNTAADLNTAMFLDVDQSQSTGLINNTEGWYYMADIGADYAAVFGQEGPGLWEWNDESETWEQSMSLADSQLDPSSNTLELVIEKDKIENPDAVDFIVGNGGPGEEWAPPKGEGSLTVGLDQTDVPDNGQIADANIDVTEETVAPGETTEVVVTFEAAASDIVTADTLGSPGAVAPAKNNSERAAVKANNTSIASIAESELTVVNTTPQASNTQSGGSLQVLAEWQNPDSDLTTYELRSEFTVSDTASDGETISFDSLINADDDSLLTDPVQVTVEEDSGSTDPPTEGEIENAAIDVTEETVAPGETTEVIVTFEAAASNTVAADTLGSPGAVAPTESSEDRDLVNSNNTSTASIAESELSIVDTTPQASNTENPAPLGVRAEWQNPDSSLTTYELRSELAVSDTATDGETITFDSAIEADGNGLLTDPVQVTVEEDGGSDDPVPDPGTGEVAATLEPTAPQVGLGGESTVDLVVTGPDAGVGSYEFTVSVGDASTVEIADIQEANTGGTGEVNLASDGSSVSVNRALLGDTIAPDDEFVLATLTVSGEAAGTTDLTVEEVIVGDEGGNSYDVVGTGAATLEVTEGVDVTGDGNPATDTTGDGKLNDIDGDGEANILDVQAFFNSLDDEAVQNNPELFDFNGDGEVSIIDVQALFNQNA